MRLQEGQIQARLTELDRELAARRTVQADKEQIELQPAWLVQLRRDIEALQKVRTDLEARVAELSTNLGTTDEERRRLLAELGTTRDRASARSAARGREPADHAVAARAGGARAARRGAAAQRSELEDRLSGETTAKDQAVEQVGS